MSWLTPWLWWGLKFAVKFIFIPYGAVCLLASVFEARLLFPGYGNKSGDWEPRHVPVENARFTSADGVKLHGWYLEHPQPVAHVLWAHGNGGNLAWRVDRLAELRRMGVSVLIFDYRGYGLSEGSPYETGLLADARAARAWLAERAKIPESQVVLLGDSLGGGVMVDLAANDGCRALVLESTYTQLPDAAAFHFPFLPVHLLMRNRLNSVSKIGRYQGPLLQCHGDRDEVIPLELGQRLHQAANQPKKFVLLAGTDHNNRYTMEWDAALAEFLRGLPSP